MKFTADDFKELYAGMPDEELLSVVPAELNPVARECYEAELLKRSLPSNRAARPVVLHPEPVAPVTDLPEASEEAVDQQEEEDLAAAAIVATREEALEGRTVLQAGGIPAFLENDLPAGFRLLVPATYVAEAKEILAAPPDDAA